MEAEHFFSRQRLVEYPQISREEYRIKFKKLVAKGIITEEKLAGIIQESISSAKCPEELLIAGGIPKLEILRSLSEHFGTPFVEFDERILAEEEIVKHLDLERLKKTLWFPLSVSQNTADVIVGNPNDPGLDEEIKKTLNVERMNKFVALPGDLIRIIENHQDVNPNFPPSAGRTPLARVRTYLAEQRTMLSWYRTSLAKGRTGLAFMRTGISFISIGLVLFRIFGIGYLTLLEISLIAAGLVMTIDGLIWYLPTRKGEKKPVSDTASEPTFGTTVLELTHSGNSSTLARTSPVESADKLRARWDTLSPVMRRRFLAIDRTDLAEERTVLANYRTIMARARTGLAFGRTGIAFIGLGIGLLREFSTGPWTLFDGALICVGTALTLEGLYWYFPGRKAGRASFRAMQRAEKRPSTWDFLLHPFNRKINLDELPPGHNIPGSPGIWGTTGLALERTLISERRNVKARLRTIMSRSRTGLSFIRTGISLIMVGLGLLLYFGAGSVFWSLFDLVLIFIGSFFVADGFYWHIPAEKKKNQFPYCFGDLEIVMPDYGQPASSWKKVVFSHDQA